MSRFYEWRPLRHRVSEKAPQFRAMIDVPTIEFCSFKETVTAENSSFMTFSDHNSRHSGQSVCSTPRSTRLVKSTSTSSGGAPRYCRGPAAAVTSGGCPGCGRGLAAAGSGSGEGGGVATLVLSTARMSAWLLCAQLAWPCRLLAHAQWGVSAAGYACLACSSRGSRLLGLPAASGGKYFLLGIPVDGRPAAHSSGFSLCVRRRRTNWTPFLPRLLFFRFEPTTPQK